MMNNPEVRTAHEVFTTDKGPYFRRRVFGVFWTKVQADEALRDNPQYTSVGKIHLVRINSKWYRYYVTPVQVQPITQCLSSDAWNCKYCTHSKYCTLPNNGHSELVEPPVVPKEPATLQTGQRLMLGMETTNPRLLVEVTSINGGDAFSFEVINGGWDGRFHRGCVYVETDDIPSLTTVKVLSSNQDRLRGHYQDVFYNWSDASYIAPSNRILSEGVDEDDDLPF